LALRVQHGTVGGNVMSFGLYVLGFVILIVGLAMAAYLLHVPAMWIGVGVVVLAGIGIISGVSHTRQRDPSNG
jgi:uncharacterized membrane protein YiaA